MPSIERDPHPYDGPIERADGRRPYNHYLWPMSGDQWWAYNEPQFWRVSGRFHFEIVGLADGRWSTYGGVASIEGNRDPWDRPCVYDNREMAIRIAVARFIRMCRAARRWTGCDRLTDERCAGLINWGLAIANRPDTRLRALSLPPPLPAKRVSSGLPLFDFGVVE